jgi:ABC-type transport system substrate-binding protein
VGNGEPTSPEAEGQCQRLAAGSFDPVEMPWCGARTHNHPRRFHRSTHPGFSPDIEKSRAEAKRLLKDAGAEGLSFELLNRNIDQPYKYNATWVIDEWSKIGVHVTQRVVPTGP